MKTFISVVLASSALAASLAGLRATEPEMPSDVGRVLLLDNERIVEGDIRREGDRYHVRRELGESWIPANKAIRLCASRDDAYHTLRARANLRDVDERLRLARWCQLHGLSEQGIEEVEAALVLRPQSAEAKRLLRCLKREAEPATPAPTPTAPVPPPPKPIKETAAPLPNAGLSMEAATLFATRVQPILMNACANCHGNDRSGSFHLIQSYGDNALNQRATQLNLAAAVMQVDRRNASASPLLVRAVSIHGDLSQPPLRGRQMPAFHTLEEWVQKVCACLPDSPVASAAATPKAGDGAFAKHTEEKDETTPSQWAADAHRAPDKVSVNAGVSLRTPDGPPVKTEELPRPDEAATKELRAVSRNDSTMPPPRPVQEPADEFDPLLFNQEAHPERVNGVKP